MSRVEKADLSAANSMCDKLAEITSCISNLKGKIDSFETNADAYMKSDTMDSIKQKMSLYKHAVDLFDKLIPNITSSITAANTAMENYMEGYSYLDTLELSELQTKLNDITKKIDDAWYKINNNTYTVTSYDNWDKEHKFPIYSVKKIYSDETIKWMRYTIECTGGWNDQKAEIKKHIEKIKNLDSAASGAWAGVESVTGSVDAFINYVSNFS